MEPSDDGMQPVPPGRPKQSWKYKAADVTMGFSSLLSNQRGPKPLRRPPHVVTKGSPPSARNVCDNCSVSQMQGLLPAPNVESEDDVDQVKQAPLPGVLGSAVATGVPCPAGKTARPDTCFMTHRYVKQEMAYLARRIDEVGRYFLALESMLGSGALGPVLKRCLKELEFYLQEPEKLEEVEEAQSFIDAAIRLGLSPVKYKPLQDRLSWLCHGRRQEELRAELAKASSAEDALTLQQLIDDSLRSGIAAREMQPARLRLQELEQQDYNERCLAAACAGDVETVEETLRKRGDCNSQQKCFPGFSLWHIAAEKGDLSLAEVAKSFKCKTALLDHSGWSALMLASAKHDHRLVRALLDAGADPSTRSSSSEMIVNCDTDEQLQSVKGRLDETGRIGCFFEWTNATTAATLDLGDQLLAGEELLLPTFQRVGGRTALHTALLRPGHESNRIAVLDQILSHDISGAGALVNVQDDMERSPLWYAVKAGFVGCARHLIRAGALVSMGSMSCLRAAVMFISEEAADDSVMCCGEDMCRLLLRNGASDCMEEIAEAEAVLEVDLRSCQGALELEDALDADITAQVTFLECSQALEDDYDLRLLTQRPQRSIASADEAADFAREVREELEELTCSVAHAFGGYVEFAPEPTAVRMSRLYRQQTRQGWIDANDWASVVGGCEATLVFPKLEDVYHALEEIAGAYSFQIRGVQDNLLSGNSQFTHRDSTYDQDSLDDRTTAAEVAAAGVAAATHVAVQRIAAGCSAENGENEEIAREVAVKGVANAADAAFRSLGLVEEAPDGVDGPGGSKSGSRSGSKPASDVLTAMERGSLLQDASIEFVEPVYPDVQLLIDCSGCVCLLRLTTERVHEVVQAELDTGRWVLEELATAMRISLLASESGSDGEDEILEILDAAEARFGRQYLAQILGIPLQDGWSCTVAGLAAHCGFASVLQILIDAGAPISQPRLPASCAPRGDYSPLSLAIAAQHWECISLLIACGADPFEDGLEELARHQSFTEAFQEKITGLLNCAREQRLVDNNALAAMVKSVKSTSLPEKIQRYLAFGADPNAESMLNTAAAAGQPELVTLLLDFGAMVLPETLDLAKGTRAEEVVRRRARARLHRAAEVHDVVTMIQLVEAGLDPDSMLPDRSSLLTYASAGDGSPHFDLVVVLLQQKADPNQVDLAGHSALLCAVQSGSVELTQELLAHAANLHWSHPEQGTAAHMAARSGQVELLEVLLDAGASCSEQDGNGHDVAMLALRAADESCVTCIRQRGVLPNRDLALSELFAAVRKGNSEYLERLLEILVKIYPGIVICTEDSLQGEARSECPSLLVEAVRQGGVNMVKALLKAGARLYPHQVTVEPLTGMEQCESAWSIARALSSEVIAELLRNQLPEELLFLSKTGSSAELQNLREEERLGLVAEPKDFRLVDESGFGALDHALMAQNLELEVWFCSHGARFQTQLEVLVEPVKNADYVALERRLRAGADVTVTDLSGRVALDWCIFTGFFESLLWDCVENSMNDEDEDGEGGATPSVSSKAATAKTARSSRSGGRLSVRSKKTAMTTSNGSAMTGRRWPLVPFDPRGNFAPIEELLISHGAKFLLTRSAAACLYEPLLLHDFKTIERRAFAGADCSVDGDQGVGMVHVALDGGGVQAACALVLNGADPDVLDAHGRSVLWRAVEGDLQRLVDACLLQNIDLSQGLGKESMSSVAHLALESNRPELSIEFLTRTHPPGTDVDEVKPPCVNPGALDSHGRTVLMRALELKHTSVAKVCLELKCSISVLDNLYEQSALHIAAEADPQMIPVLLEVQADINLVDKRGQSPLLTAAACGQLESVTLLHQGGAQLGPAGSFATMMAIEAGHFDVAAEIITMAGPFRPTELHRLRAKHSKKGTGPGTTLAPAAPGKMCMKAAELRAGAVMEAYLLQALRKLGYDASDFVQRFVQWILSGPSQEMKSRSSLLEDIPTRLSDLELDKVLQMLEARSVPAPVVQLLASASRFDPQPVREQAADPESRPPEVPALEDSRLDPPPPTTQTSEPEQAEASVASSKTEEDQTHHRSQAAAEMNDPADQQAEAPMAPSRTDPTHQRSQAAAEMKDPSGQQAEAPMVPSRTEDPKHQRSQAAAERNDPADQQAEAPMVPSRTDPTHQRSQAAVEMNDLADQQAEAPMVSRRTEDPKHQRSQAAGEKFDPADQQAEAPMVPSRTDPTHQRSQAAAEMNDPSDQQAEAPMVPSRTEDPKHQRSQAAAEMNDPSDQQAEAPMVPSRTEDPKHQRSQAAAERNDPADQQAEAPVASSRTDPTHHCQKSEALAEKAKRLRQEVMDMEFNGNEHLTHENLSAIPENAPELLDQPPHEAVEMAERNEEPQVVATETARDSMNEETQEYEEDDFENETEASELSPRSPRTFG